MITTKELQYVNERATKIPMPGMEYSSNVMNKIEECYKVYKTKFQNKEYNIIFSNGEEISFEILACNICHMLGIDFSNIRNEYFDEYRAEVLGFKTLNFTSTDLLETIIEKKDKIVELDNDRSNCKKIINYYKSQIKCDIFEKLDFENFNFGAINYKKDDTKFEYDKQKTLFVPSSEPICPYFMMGIKISEYKESEYVQKYVVNTLIAPREPKKSFEEQEVIIPTQMLISDKNELKKIIATPEEKIKLLTMYKNIINTYKIPYKLNTCGDYENMLNEMSKQYKKTSI